MLERSAVDVGVKWATLPPSPPRRWSGPSHTSPPASMAAVSTGTTRTPGGTSRSTVDTSATDRCCRAELRGEGVALLAELRLAITHGSIGSRVPPALTTTCQRTLRAASSPEFEPFDGLDDRRRRRAPHVAASESAGRRCARRGRVTWRCCRRPPGVPTSRCASRRANTIITGARVANSTLVSRSVDSPIRNAAIRPAAATRIRSAF